MIAKSTLREWLASVLLLIFAPAISAQMAGFGTLLGTISDAMGTAAPNVTVTATNKETGTNANFNDWAGWFV